MPSGPIETRLQKILVTNATVSGLTGAVLLAFAPVIDRLMGTQAPAIVRAVGAGLVLFAAGVFAVGRTDGRTLVVGARQILILDVAWVLGSFAIALTGWFTSVGLVIVAVVAAVVGAFAVGEAVALRQLAGPAAGSRQRSVGV